MAQFDRYLDFKFNGFDSKGKYTICTLGGSDMNSDYGVDRSINEEEGIGDTPVFYSVKDNCPTFKVSISKINNGSISPFTDSDLAELSRVLFKKEYKPLTINNLTYYVIFTKGSLWRIGSGEGVITLDVRLSSPHAYSSIITHPYRIKTSKEFEVMNQSTYDDFIYPDIEIEMISGNSIQIINQTTGEILEFNNLENNEHIYIYNDNMKQMTSKVNSSRNIYDKSNKVFIKLPYGINRFKVIADDCKFNLIYQNKINLY